MNTYNTFFGFYALSNTPMWLDYEEKNVAGKAPVKNIIINNLNIDEKKSIKNNQNIMLKILFFSSWSLTLVLLIIATILS